MRPKFVLALLLLVFLVLGGALLLKQHHGGGTEIPVAPASATPAPPIESNAVAITAPAEPTPAPIVIASPITNTVTPETIDAEVDHLYEWSMNNDPQSLSNILADLTNPNEDIRKAAIEAAEQFGSTNAIPALKAAAEATEDLQEKIAYLEAADFLTLPQIDFSSPGTATPKTPEQIQMDQQKQAARDARRQQRHGSVPDQNSQSSPANSQNPAQSSGANQ